MIIGGNHKPYGNQGSFGNPGNNGGSQKNGFNTQFQERFQMIQDQAKKHENRIQQNSSNSISSKNPYFSGNNRPGDIMDKNNMADKSLDLLKDRLDRNEISLDEFNRKASQINHFRDK